MKIELFLDEDEEYPQVFSVWRLDKKTGRADLTTRRNYVDDREGGDQWRKTDDESIRLKAENAKLRELAVRMFHTIEWSDRMSDSMYWPSFSYERELRELGVEVNG